MSPQNVRHDRLKKFDLYMRFGAKECWIVNPKLKAVEVNVLNEYGEYDKVGFYEAKDILDCKSFKGLDVELSHIFE